MSVRARVKLPDALHARPANLLVRLAQQFDAMVRVERGSCGADACKILDILALGAAKGDEVEIIADGSAAAEALEAITTLIARNFDGDLVPETGAAVVEGIAIGKAVVWSPAALDLTTSTKREVAEERTRLDLALRRAESGLRELIGALPESEAQLFEPEIEILHELGPSIRARVAKGEVSEAAVRAETAQVSTDLLLDARARLLEALADEVGGALTVLLALCPGDRILVTSELTPTVVASLPAHVVGIVASNDDGSDTRGTGYTSHAAILARGREIPLVFVADHVAAVIVDDDTIVLDTFASSARVWVAPTDALIAEARERKSTRARERELEGAKVTAPLTHLDVAVRVNIGSLHELVPVGAEGVGLLRTELLFSGRATAPSEAEQHAALVAIAARVNGAPLVARLFDAGGDKLIPWLTPPETTPDARGIALLMLHGAVLDAQLAAMVRAAERADIRVLLPMVTCAGDVEGVRARSKGKIQVGAMIETPEAAMDAAAIAAAADFVCIGTNDLTALVLGHRREDAAAPGKSTMTHDSRVLALIARVVAGAHAHGRKVTVCGEMAADPHGARILVGLGVDALSVATAKLAATKVSLLATTRDDCRAVAIAALGTDP